MYVRQQVFKYSISRDFDKELVTFCKELIPVQ